AAKAATSTIPILIITSSDPVKSGLIASFNRPGGNITGLMTATSVLEAKKFGLLCEMVPGARVVAMIINPDYPPHNADAVEVQSAAQSIGRQLIVLKAGNPEAMYPRQETCCAAEFQSRLPVIFGSRPRMRDLGYFLHQQNARATLR